MTGYGTDEKNLEREVTIRTETFSQAQVLEKQLKVSCYGLLFPFLYYEGFLH